MSTRLLHAVVDYAPSGLEHGEIMQQLHRHLDNPQEILIHFHSIVLA